MLRDEGEWRDALRDGRGFQRVPVTDVTAALVGSALGRVPATLSDLSQGGCRVRTRARCHPGQQFSIRIARIEPRLVTVAWAGDGELGVAFDRPLAWNVVTGIAFGQPTDSPARASAAR